MSNYFDIIAKSYVSHSIDKIAKNLSKKKQSNKDQKISI